MPDTTCAIAACDRRTRCRGLCGMHYERWRVHGDPATVHKVKDRQAKEAWITSTTAASTNECVEWPWGRDDDGYGSVTWQGRRRRVSHLILAASGRPRPGQAIALHSCDNPPCGNPAHLRWGTPQDNMTDKMTRGRWGGGRPRTTNRGA